MLDDTRSEFSHDWFSKPADSLLGLMRRRNVSVEEVANQLDGGMETMRRLIEGTHPIDSALANSLAVAVGGSSEFWLKRQAKYDSALNHAFKNAAGEMQEWLRLVPSPSNKRRGRLSDRQKENEIRERMAFYGVASLDAWHTRYGQARGATQFRTSPAYASDDGSVSLWLRQGELEASLMTTQRWSPKKLRALLPHMLKLSKVRHVERFLPKLRTMGAECGVAIVVLRAPKGCRASGASRLATPEKAMVMLSFRHLSDDHFWFTLMHEFGHLLLHDAKTFVDSDDTLTADRCEQEANQFASSCIIPPSRWEEFSNLACDRESILRFSVSLGIAPGLVVGQLQHRSMIPHNRLNYLKRRWTWGEIAKA